LNYSLSRKDCEESLKEFKEEMKLFEILNVKEINGCNRQHLVVVKYKNDKIIRRIAEIAFELISSRLE
jgi:hypothetical protein